MVKQIKTIYRKPIHLWFASDTILTYHH
jgi:hypothetical protein